MTAAEFIAAALRLLDDLDCDIYTETIAATGINPEDDDVDG
jgi:hypothetical protein